MEHVWIDKEMGIHTIVVVERSGRFSQKISSLAMGGHRKMFNRGHGRGSGGGKDRGRVPQRKFQSAR